jgi:hypothetical protein
VLPQGHPGPHSFNLPPAPGSAISSEDPVRIA